MFNVIHILRILDPSTPFVCTEEYFDRYAPLMYMWFVFQEANLATVRKVIADNVAAASHHMEHIMYNHKMMGFLFQQMQQLQGIFSDPNFEFEGQSWQKTCDELKKALALGLKLIERHCSIFNLQKFYKSSQALTGVEIVCEHMQQVLTAWEQEIDYAVPLDVFDEDQEFLKSCLNCVFGDTSATFEDEGLQKWAPCQQKWEAAKAHHRKCLQHLEIASDGDVEPQKKIGNGRFVVYRAKYKGQDAAAKKMGEFEMDSATGLEDFANFFCEAYTQATLKHDHIANLMAVTRSGWLIMELATCDLERLCRKQHAMDWKTKINILVQIATGLEYMHSRNPPVVHCDIKSHNILVFGDAGDLNSCTFKITDFGLSVFDEWTASMTVRRPGGTPQWMAPELYSNKHPITASDVYSFGIIMYELASQRPPYGEMAPPTTMAWKLDGKPPCQLPRDCPQELEHLMKVCCATEPKIRPKIRAVMRWLRRIVA